MFYNNSEFYLVVKVVSKFASRIKNNVSDSYLRLPQYEFSFSSSIIQNPNGVT